MTTKDSVNNSYFKWMYNLVCGKRFSKYVSYKKLLMYLHDIEFTYIISKDKNRYDDGIDLRCRFSYEHPEIKDADLYLQGPCSVLEMMVALSIRCEENIMDDPEVGDRTGQWFWGMIVSLGLGSMSDNRFDKRIVDYSIDRFLNREYEPNGKGGLFTIKDCKNDLRFVEIWYQLCQYLDGII